MTFRGSYDTVSDCALQVFFQQFLLFVGNVLAVRAVCTQDRHLLVGLGTEDIYSHEAIRCLQLNCGILLVDVWEAVLVHLVEVLDFVRHFAGRVSSAITSLVSVQKTGSCDRCPFARLTRSRARHDGRNGSIVTPHHSDGVRDGLGWEFRGVPGGETE
jgi:hypothetical protein